MKKILWLSIIFSLLFVSHTFADSSLSNSATLSAAATGNTINATLSGVTNGADMYKLIVQTTPIPTTGVYNGSAISPLDIGTDPTLKNPSTPTGGSLSSSVTWTISGYLANTTYYVGVVEASSVGKASYLPTSATVKTTDATITFFPISTTVSNNNIIVSGKIDTTKIGNLTTSGFKATLQYTTNVPQVGATTLPSPQGPLTARKTDAIDGPEGINDDGTYFWVIASPQPSTLYYLQQTITDPAGNTKVDVIAQVNSSNGNVILPGSAAQTADLNTRSYTLLSKGFPGLSVLPDPDLCAQERAAGQHPQFCDMNDVINYFMKLMIGLCAVVLVFRLMYEGYNIMVSDVPQLKASAKSGFLTALGGLLLALSSFIILNTINPKLVNGSVTVDQLAIGTDADTDFTPITQDTGAPTTGSAGKCSAGLTTVTVQKSSFRACSTYNGIPVAANLQSMLTAAYAAGITLEGGGYRNSAAQTALRIQHCGGDLTNPKAVCDIPVAPVGQSNHESGLAFDFNCNGGSAYSIQNTACFTWLQQNAGHYQLINYVKEPWHWSWDGR